MADYTAADVKRLRELTGSGMLDCKNALASNGGDFDKAVEALRIKGAKDVGKRAERATAEGLVAAKGGALIELNSETDFVAKNAEFQKLAEQVVDAALAAKATDVDALNAARPDIVFLTGDYITRKGDPLERIPDLLGRLQVPAVAVLGNHDHWTDAATITRDLERIGIAVLRNRHTVVQVRGRALAVVGVDDAVSGHDDVADAFKGVARHAPRLVLAHSPPTLDALPPDAGLACFSGHTHGGQIFVAGVTDAFFSRAGQHYLRGHYRNQGNQLYVSRGLGFGKGSTLPRMNADPEVALITLRRLSPPGARPA